MQRTRQHEDQRRLVPCISWGSHVRSVALHRCPERLLSLPSVTIGKCATLEILGPWQRLLKLGWIGCRHKGTEYGNHCLQGVPGGRMKAQASWHEVVGRIPATSRRPWAQVKTQTEESS